MVPISDPIRALFCGARNVRQLLQYQLCGDTFGPTKCLASVNPRLRLSLLRQCLMQHPENENCGRNIPQPLSRHFCKVGDYADLRNMVFWSGTSESLRI